MVHRFNPLARLGLVFLVALAFLAVSTIALAHVHPDAKSIDESHCALCLAVHNATHAVTAPILALSFTAVQSPFLVPLNSILPSIAWPTLNQDRAPPSL